MIEFSAYLAAQHVTKNAAHEALPNAPVRADDVVSRRQAPRLLLRQRISQSLRKLADLVEPCPEPAEPAMAGCQ